MQPTNPSLPERLLAEHGRLGSLARALLQDVHVADDAVQDTIVAALEASPDARAPLGPWLGTVLRNRVRTQRARRSSRSEREQERSRSRPEASSPSPEELAERLELRRTVTDLVAALEEPLRAVIQLRFFEELAPKDIAKHLGTGSGVRRNRGGRADAIELPFGTARLVPQGAAGLF